MTKFGCTPCSKSAKAFLLYILRAIDRFDVAIYTTSYKFTTYWSVEMARKGSVLKQWYYPQKVIDNIEAIKVLTGEPTYMGVVTHAVAAYLYGLTQHIYDVEIITEDDQKEGSIINNIPTPVSDADYWRKIAENKKQ